MFSNRIINMRTAVALLLVGAAVVCCAEAGKHDSGDNAEKPIRIEGKKSTKDSVQPQVFVSGYPVVLPRSQNQYQQNPHYPVYSPPPTNYGCNCRPGLPGPPGLPGIPGYDGAPGVKGDKGDAGRPGYGGQHGVKGEKGDTGDKGRRGDRGEKGDGGEPGSKGDQGYAGYPGPSGPQGTPGYPGKSGLPGQDGLPGPVGPPGVLGGLQHTRPHHSKYPHKSYPSHGAGHLLYTAKVDEVSESVADQKTSNENVEQSDKEPKDTTNEMKVDNKQSDNKGRSFINK